MYIIRYDEHRSRVSREIRTDPDFYHWVSNNDITIYRLENDRCEQLFVLQEARPWCSFLCFVGEWREVPLEG